MISLMEKYDRWKREIGLRNHMGNKRLDGQFVRIPGYALPLEHKDIGVKELLLVPYVGACIHVPPPPNQTVYVKLSDPYTVKNLYEPVWITGHLSMKDVTKSLSLVDGNTGVDIGYRLDGVEVVSFED